MSKEYLNTIVKHYEECLQKYGDSHLGVDWPKEEDVDKRYKVMLEVIKFSAIADNIPKTLLDFGCGTGHLLSYIKKQGMDNVNYAGLDISEKFIKISKEKFPAIPFFQIDILEEKGKLPDFDFIVMNGVFTEKRELSFEEMWAYFTRMLLEVFTYTKVGFAFNVMSKNVAWEREDLFHVPLDRLSDFICNQLTRNFVIRNDYGLYEYTTYVYK